jgi:SAM-dependent methyltransferase
MRAIFNWVIVAGRSFGVKAALALFLLLCVACAPGCGSAPQSEAGSPEHPGGASGGQSHSDGRHPPGHFHGHSDGHSHGEGHKGPLVHRFEDAEKWAPVFDDPARDAWQRPADVVAALRITPGMTVADLGAGTGYFEPHLARAVGPSGAVLALDIEPDMVRYLRDRAAREGLANVRPGLVKLDDPSLAPGSVDRILIVDTWHHIADRVAYAGKLKAALRPGGSIAIVDFTLDSERGPPKHHRTPPDTVIAELGAAGLSAEVIEEPLPDQYIVIGKAKP